jgi:hypothetical protein
MDLILYRQSAAERVITVIELLQQTTRDSLTLKSCGRCPKIDDANYLSLKSLNFFLCFAETEKGLDYSLHWNTQKG